MNGISKPFGLPWFLTLVPIRLLPDGTYTIHNTPIQYAWSVIDDNLLAWTKAALDTFYDLELAVNTEVRRLRASGAEHLTPALTLAPETCHKMLVAPAKTGLLAYNSVFSDAAARAFLNDTIFAGLRAVGLIACPTFVSRALPFAWELLYEGTNWRDGDPDKFWGFAHAVARSQVDPMLQPALEQDPKSNMLFCLHQSLRQAHQIEWPRIRSMVRATIEDQVYLLGTSGLAGQVTDGEALLDYLGSAEHNMLHFACHCVQRVAANDILLLSLLPATELDADPAPGSPEIGLETETFTLTKQTGRFQKSTPLVFLNACQSAGGADRLHANYHLPGQFIERGAAAVVATACPVPDVFAAEFARVFYGYFLRGYEMLADEPEKNPVGRLPIGEALRRTRVYFLKKHNNPMGLAYGLYTPAHYQVKEPLLAGGASA